MTAIDIYKQAALEDGWTEEQLNRHLESLNRSKSPWKDVPVPPPQEREMIEAVKALGKLTNSQLSKISAAMETLDRNQ